MKIYGKLLLVMVLGINLAWALDIDEKLTSRILRVSSSQHTILLNRGLEDGLVLGDHAKFFLPEGVIARGVIVKASPTRSVWSLYRLINPSLIKADTVVEIKIASPVQLTSDPSKAFDRVNGPADVLTENKSVAQVTAVPGVPMGNPLPAAENLSASDQEDLADLGVQTSNVNQLHKNVMPSKYPLADRLWEVWAGGYYSTMTAKENNTFERFSYNTAPSFSIGAERYFTQGAWRNWSFSLFGHLYNAQKETSLRNEIGYDAQVVTYKTRLLHGGLGANYYFWHDPHATYQVIGFAAANLGTGVSRDYMQVSNAVTINNRTSKDGMYNGSAFFGALGVGLKFNTDNGAGVRLVFDYYYGHQIYTFDGDYPNATQNFSGIRWMLAGSYRF